MKNLAGTKLFALLAALLMVVGLFALGAVPSFADGSGTENDPYIVDTWADLKTKMAAGGYIKLNADVTDSDKTQESSLSVPDGVAVELDLNGHTVDRGGSHLRYGYVICVGGSGAELTIRDSVGGGKITGGNHKQYSSSP